MTVSLDQTIKSFDLNKRCELRTYDVGTRGQEILSLQLANNDKFLIAQFTDDTVTILDFWTGLEQYSINVPRNFQPFHLTC